MYLPETFAECDTAILRRIIREESFATLISLLEGVPYASHVPLLLEETEGASAEKLQGKLIGHVARANPQWKSMQGEQVLAIFHGPHAYISPTWYGQGDAVPTWSYIAVHVVGRATIIDDRDHLRSIVSKAVDYFESSRNPRWSMEQVSEEYIDKLLGGIVGFEIAIEQVEGKFKLSQNQSVERRSGVIQGLEQSASPFDREVARRMRELES